jgi:hypothetical protein
MAGAFVSERRSTIRRLVVLASLLLGVRADAQSPMGESQVKAMFVYNFLKFVEWPVEAPLGAKEPFVVVIIGEGTTADATRHFLESKAVGERPVVVRRGRWDQSLSGVRAAFVVERDARKLRHIFDRAAEAGVLTIGEGESFATNGGVIALLVEDRKVRFDVDTTAAQLAGLRISSKLLALTRAVRSPATPTGSR